MQTHCSALDAERTIRYLLTMKPTSSRRHDIDLVRGMGLVGMVVFHAAFDLSFLGLVSIDVWQGGWSLLARMVQIIFMVTTGMTLALSYQRGGVRKVVRHAVVLAGWAFFVTMITGFLFKERAIFFGVLHFYTVAMMLALPLLRLGKWCSPIGIVLLIVTPLLPSLGIFPASFQPLDYFPLLPWMGIFLQGVALADFPLPPLPFRVKALEVLGRRSLLIYLVHQPVLLGLLWVLTGR